MSGLGHHISPKHQILPSIQLHHICCLLPSFGAQAIANMNLSFDALKDQVANLSLYDIKAGVRKVQNGEQGKLSLLGHC